MPAGVLRAVEGVDLRSGSSLGVNQSSHEALGCSKPFVAGGGIHVVLNEEMASGVVRNHFVTASLDRGGGDAGRTGRVRSWCCTGTRPVRAVQALDEECTTLVYAKGGLFCFATGPPEHGGTTSTALRTTVPGAGSPSFRAAAAAAAVAAAGGGGSSIMGIGREGGVAGVGGGRRGGGGGAVSDSLPVHSGSIVDFRVNQLSRDIVSGCDHGHVHILNFPPDMAGVPTMKVSKYVAQPLSSVRWGRGEPYIASWTSSRGLLQMLDTRDNRVATSIQVEGTSPIHTHEYLSDMMLAVGCGAGCVQLFDVRKMKAFVTLQDSFAGSVRQIVPLMGSDCSAETSSAGPCDWVAFGTAGLSRYTVVGGNSNGNAGAAVGISTGGDLLSRVAKGLSCIAGCRTSDLSLSAGLDSNAGLFVAPPPRGSGSRQQQQQQQQQLCGITLDSRIVFFSASSPPGDGNGSGRKGRATAPTTTAAAAAPLPSLPLPSSQSFLRSRSPVAPAEGTNLSGDNTGGSGSVGAGERNSTAKERGRGGDLDGNGGGRRGGSGSSGGVNKGADVGGKGGGVAAREEPRCGRRKFKSYAAAS